MQQKTEIAKKKKERKKECKSRLSTTLVPPSLLLLLAFILVALPHICAKRARPMVHLLPIDLCLAAIVLFPLFSSVAAVPQDNTFEIVGNSGVSAQQLFLGKQNKVYIVDKTENNPVSVNGHPAWATEYDIDTNEFRVMDIRTNSFCAGGNVLGNGTWLNVGGNQRIKKNGETIMEGDVNIYGNESGGKALRSLDPCTDGTCAWTDDGSNYMTTQRWYPTLETLEDGSIIIVRSSCGPHHINYLH